MKFSKGQGKVPVSTAGTSEATDSGHIGEQLIRLPAVLARVQISRSAWLLGVKEGRYPRGHLLGPRTRVWRSSEIEAFIRTLGESEGQQR